MMTNYGLTFIALAWLIAAGSKSHVMKKSFVWFYVIGLALLVADTYQAGITSAVFLNMVALVAAFITAIRLKKA